MERSGEILRAIYIDDDVYEAVRYTGVAATVAESLGHLRYWTTDITDGMYDFIAVEVASTGSDRPLDKEKEKESWQ